MQLPWKGGHENPEIAFRRLESATNKLKTCGTYQNCNDIPQEWEHADIKPILQQAMTRVMYNTYLKEPYPRRLV